MQFNKFVDVRIIRSNYSDNAEDKKPDFMEPRRRSTSSRKLQARTNRASMVKTEGTTDKRVSDGTEALVMHTKTATRYLQDTRYTQQHVRLSVHVSIELNLQTSYTIFITICRFTQLSTTKYPLPIKTYGHGQVEQ